MKSFGPPRHLDPSVNIAQIYRTRRDENTMLASVSNKFSGWFNRLKAPRRQDVEKGPAPREHIKSGALKKFRLLLGIDTDCVSFDPRGTSRPGNNLGLYRRVVTSETDAHNKYKRFKKGISACYFLQIIIAASLTALGAANADNKAITAFGAINTIIAGFLTFLQGSGIPGRYKYYADQWRKIREEIEQIERELARPDREIPHEHVMAEVQRIWNLYRETCRDIDMNTPDSYNSITAHRTQAPAYDTTTAADSRSIMAPAQKNQALSQKSSHSDMGLKSLMSQEG